MSDHLIIPDYILKADHDQNQKSRQFYRLMGWTYPFDHCPCQWPGCEDKGNSNE